MSSSLAVRLIRTRGRLGLGDRARLVIQGAFAQLGLASVPRSVAVDVERILVATHAPRGALATAALRACEASSPRWLTSHCMRTWAWGAALGAATGVSFDSELLFAAALLHDLGLTDAYAPTDGECFAVSSARAAEQITAEVGVSSERARAIVEAIVLHLEVRVALSHGAEAHLLHAGAGCDVLGARLRSLPASVVEAVLREHPRDEMNRALSSTMSSLAEAAPATRLGLYCRRFAFAARVRSAPFAEGSP